MIPAEGDRAIDAYRVEQPAIVGDEQQRAVEGVERLLELLDGREVEVVRRLVEHEAVAAVHHEQPEHGSRPFAG